MTADGTGAEDFKEEVEVSYLVFEQKFYIIENVNSPNLKGGDDDQIPATLSSAGPDYERVWICEQVQNRPYFMRVTFLTQVHKAYTHGRGGCGGERLAKSVGALRAYLQ